MQNVSSVVRDVTEVHTILLQMGGECRKVHMGRSCVRNTQMIRPPARLVSREWLPYHRKVRRIKMFVRYNTLRGLYDFGSSTARNKHTVVSRTSELVLTTFDRVSVLPGSCHRDLRCDDLGCMAGAAEMLSHSCCKESQFGNIR